MVREPTLLFQMRLRGLQQAMKIHGGHLTIHPDGVYLNNKGKTLANTWEDVGECLGEAWKDFFGGPEDAQSTGT